MKKPWDRMRLMVNYWHAQHTPVEGDEVCTKRGRRYLIIDIVGEPITALICLVLPNDEKPTTGRTFLWTWDKR